MTKNKKKLRRVERRYSVTKSAQTLVLAGMLLAGGVSGAMAEQAELTAGPLTEDTTYSNADGYKATGTTQLQIGTHTATFTTAGGLTINKTGGHDGILGYGDSGYTGKVVFDTGFGTGTISNGSAIGAAVIEIKAGTLNLSGARTAGASEHAWRAGSILMGDQGVNVSGGTINLGDKALLTAGFAGSDTTNTYTGINVTGGKIVLGGTSNANNASVLVASSRTGTAIPEAKYYTTLKIAGGTVEVAASNHGVIASRDTTISSGTLNVAGNLLMVGAMGNSATNTDTGFAGADQTSKSKLVLKDTGTITVGANGKLYAPQVEFIQDGGTVTNAGRIYETGTYTLNGGTLDLTGAAGMIGASSDAMTDVTGTFTMNGGTLNVGASSQGSQLQMDKVTIAGGIVTIQGKVGDVSSTWTDNSMIYGGLGESTGSLVAITGGTVNIGKNGQIGVARDTTVANSMDISGGTVKLQGDSAANAALLHASSGSAKEKSEKDYSKLNISNNAIIEVANSNFGAIASRETNMSGGALNVNGSLVVAGGIGAGADIATGITAAAKKWGEFNLTGGAVNVASTGKLDFATGKVDLNVNGGKVTATGLNVGTTAVGTAGWVDAEKVTTTSLDLSGTGTGAGINVGKVDIASGGYLKIAGDHTMAGDKLTDSTAANSISVANGGHFKVDTLTLTGGANVASGVTVGGTVEVDAINATNGNNATALEWNKGTLKIMGVTGAGAFSNATSLGVKTAGTVMLGDANDVEDSAGGSYGGAVTVGSGGTLKVEAGDWTLKKLITETATGVSITGGKLVVGSGTTAGSLIATNVGTDKVVVNGVNAVLEAAWGDVIAADGYQNGILTGTKGTLMLRKDGNYKLSDLEKASKYNASSASGLLVGINTTGKLVDDNNNAVTELDTTQAGTVQGALFDVSVKPTTGTTVELGKTVGQTVAFKDIDLSNGSGVSIENNSNVTLIEGISNGAGKTTTLNNATVTLGNTEAGNKNSTITTGITAATGNNKLVIATGDHTVLGAVTQGSGATIDFEIGQGNLITKDVFTANEVAISNGKNLEGEKTITLTTANLNGSAVKTTTDSADIVITTANIGDNGGAVNSGKDLTVTTVNTNNKTTILTAGNDVTLTNGVSTTGGLLIQAGKEINAAGEAISGGAGSRVQASQLNAATVALAGGELKLTDKTTTSTLTGALNLGSDTGGLSAVAGKVDGTLDLKAGGNLVGGSSLAVNELTIAAAQTLNVGNKEETGSKGTLSVNKLANGGTIFADPAWIGGAAHDTSYASQVAIEGFATAGQLNSNIIGGQASQIVIGSADTAWVKDKLDKYNAEYQTNIWGGNGAGQVTAALGIAKAVTLDANNKLHIDGASTTVATSGTNNTASFGANSLLIVDAKGVGAANTALTAGIIDVAADAKLMVSNTTVGSTYKVATAGAGALDIDATSWRDGNLLTDHRLLAGTLTVDAATNATVTINQRSATSVLPGLSGAMGGLIDQMIKQNLTSENSPHAGVRFANRAINRLNGEQAAATIEGAAQLAVVGAAPAMTLSAVQAGTSTVTTRTSFASPLLDSSKAVALHKDVDGTLSVDSGLNAGNGMKNGFGLWIMPLYQSNSAWGMKADGFKGGYKSDLGGVALGADYTFNDMFRLGLAFNIGGGYAESNGDFNKTENSFNFWGINAYGGWTMNNFGITADVGYTGNYNKLEQELPGAMGMGDIKSDVNSSAWTAGLRGEYKFATEALDIIPHVGVRYTGLTTDEYKAKSGGDTVFKVDQDFQSIWTFPIGVTLAKEIETGSGWIIRPQVDLGITPATGDVKAKSKVRIPGVDAQAEMKMQVVDYMSYDGGVGLEMKKDNISFGINYNIQASEHRTGHGVFGTFRYEF